MSSKQNNEEFEQLLDSENDKTPSSKLLKYKTQKITPQSIDTNNYPTKVNKQFTFGSN